MADLDTELQSFAKDVIESRTLWVAALAPLAVTLFPPLAPIMAANPVASAWVAGGLMAALRFVTTKKIKTPWSASPAQPTDAPPK